MHSVRQRLVKLGRVLQLAEEMERPDLVQMERTKMKDKMPSSWECHGVVIEPVESVQEAKRKAEGWLAHPHSQH